MGASTAHSVPMTDIANGSQHAFPLSPGVPWILGREWEAALSDISSQNSATFSSVTSGFPTSCLTATVMDAGTAEVLWKLRLQAQACPSLGTRASGWPVPCRPSSWWCSDLVPATGFLLCCLLEGVWLGSQQRCWRLESCCSSLFKKSRLILGWADKSWPKGLH